MPLGTADKPDTGHADDFDAWEREMRSPGDKHWNDLVSRNLSDRENTSQNPESDNTASSESSSGNSKNINNKENSTKNPSSKANWKNNVSKPKIGSKNSIKNTFIKRFGPTGAVIGLMTGGALGLSSTTLIPGSIFLSIKENVVTQLDQQNYTANSRSNRIIARRLSGEATSGSCSIVKFACRYTKPSTYQLEQLSKHNVKMFDANGNVLEKNTLIGGTRPTHISVDDGPKIDASDFRKALRNDATIRAAFTRAYNPRWANWVDDKAAALFKRLGVSKSLPEKLSKAKNADEIAEATADLVKASDQDADTLKNKIDTEARDFTKRETKKILGKNEVALMTAQAICAASQAPGIVVDVQKAYRVAQYARIGYAVLTMADKIKKGDATPEEVSNIGTILTQTYLLSDGSTKKSAMDSSLMKYAIGLGTGGSNSSYIPSVGSSLAKYLQFANSSGVKKTCSALTSAAASVLVDSFKAARAGAGPAGWASIAVEVAIEVIVAIPWVQEKITERAEDVASLAVAIIGDIIDYNKLAESFFGNLTNGAKGTDIGDISSIAWATSMADQASYVGNMPLTTSQKVAFDEQIVNPTKIAWAEEDRLTHSPFDISNPNTFMGSIAMRFVPYLGSMSNPLSFLSSVATISASSLYNFTNPTASATTVSSNLCKQNSLLADMQDLAIGPACDIQYGIPAEYMGIDPDKVVEELYKSGNIDEEGQPVADSALEGWMSACNNARMVNVNSCTVKSREDALFGLYQIDSRQATNMDKNPEVMSELPDSSSSSSSSSANLPDGDIASLAQEVLDNPNVTYGATVGSEFQNMANGQPARFGVTLDKRLLQVIVAISREFSINISSLVREKPAGDYSLHPYGEAVDIAIINGKVTTGADSETYRLLDFILDKGLLPKGAGVGQQNCGTRSSSGMNDKLTRAGFKTHDDTCHHLHLALRISPRSEKTW